MEDVEGGGGGARFLGHRHHIRIAAISDILMWIGSHDGACLRALPWCRRVLIWPMWSCSRREPALTTRSQKMAS